MTATGGVMKPSSRALRSYISARQANRRTGERRTGNPPPLDLRSQWAVSSPQESIVEAGLRRLVHLELLVVHTVPRLPVGMAHADEREAAGNAPLVEREIFRAHDRIHPADGAGVSWLHRHSEVMAKAMREDGRLGMTVRADATNAERIRGKFALQTSS